VACLTENLQNRAGGQLLIAADQEGGKVSRFAPSRGFPTTPPAAELGNAPDAGATFASARQTAQMLKDAGVNVNLAPVVDLNLYPDNPIIGRYGRAFSATPALVIEHARIWIEEHRQKGISCCLKHFPGHGSSRHDSHHGFVDITDTWQRHELEPYRELISRGFSPAIMVGHLFHRQLDHEHPATLSVKIVTTLLRHQLQFAGLVLSDDMQMRAITDRHDLATACGMALTAGIDMLILGNNLEFDPYLFRKMRQAVARGVREGTIAAERIEDAWQRVQNFKKMIAT
jgi:beta-N-acetylhexosaminidase